MRDLLQQRRPVDILAGGDPARHDGQLHAVFLVGQELHEVFRGREVLALGADIEAIMLQQCLFWPPAVQAGMV